MCAQEDIVQPDDWLPNDFATEYAAYSLTDAESNEESNASSDEESNVSTDEASIVADDFTANCGNK